MISHVIILSYIDVGKENTYFGVAVLVYKRLNTRTRWSACVWRDSGWSLIYRAGDLNKNVKEKEMDGSWTTSQCLTWQHFKPSFFNVEYSISSINTCLISQQMKYNYIICIEQNCKKKIAFFNYKINLNL